MTDEKIRDEFENLPKWLQELWDIKPSLAREAEKTIGGFRATERLAKIEVLEYLSDYLIHFEPYNTADRIKEMLSSLKGEQ